MKYIDDNNMIEVYGRSGKTVRKNIFDMNIDGKLEANKDGKYEVWLTRWYRLPKVYDTLTEATADLFSFIKEYDKLEVK